MKILNENERLVFAGNIALRAPNGAELPAVPQYRIVRAGEPAAGSAVELKDTERLITVGSVHTERETAEERFAALKAGQAQGPRADGEPLYIIESAANINPKTRLSEGEEKAIEPLLEDLLSTFAMQMRKRKALERQAK